MSSTNSTSPGSFRLFRRERLHDQVVRHIGHLLVRGAESLGERTLPTEAELCGQFKVSRTVLREAVKVLAAKGLLEVRQKTGMRVRPRKEWNHLDPDVLTWHFEVGPDKQIVENIFELRRIIECSAAELAAIRATDDDIAEISKWYREMESNVEDYVSFIHADVLFHEAILGASHNLFLEKMCTTIANALRLGSAITARLPTALAGSLPYHKAIAEAIRSHDGPAARAAFERGLDWAMSNVEHVLDPSADAKDQRPPTTSP